jgi:hypothetical protein
MRSAAPRIARRGLWLLPLAALALAACQSEPRDAAPQTAQTARLELQPRQSSFRDIGKRGDSDLEPGKDAR